MTRAEQYAREVEAAWEQFFDYIVGKERTDEQSTNFGNGSPETAERSDSAHSRVSPGRQENVEQFNPHVVGSEGRGSQQGGEEEEVAATENFKVGDRVEFRRPDGAQASDQIRELFTQTTLLEPYARNLTYPAAILTEHSWMPLSALRKEEQ